MADKAAVRRGRYEQARRNDYAVIAAAREVFIENPEAKMADVAHRAGVGQASLYRRYRTKNELLNLVCADGLNAAAADAESALRASGDPWEVFGAFMVRFLQSGAGAQLILAGSFVPDESLIALGGRVSRLVQQVVDRAIAAGVLRSDITGSDLPLLAAQLGSMRSANKLRDRELQRRYLGVILDGLRAPAHSQLPGRAPDQEEIEKRWRST
ncbi:TetR/AcrR family transcriptional regulator (plasmid) [Mycolicibacterium psychrotolerans]|uniref:TetR/AcrR family transcriptional regulator n=1 Tax=Mycolicibacterium psychrotolerans TaxID=216929 RepID=UPI003D67564B